MFVYGTTLFLNACTQFIMDLSTNKVLFGLVLVVCLWAPVYLVRTAPAVIAPASRTLKKAVAFGVVLAGLVAVYAVVLDSTTRVLLGIPSLVVLTAYLAVTLIQKSQRRA